MRSRSCLISHRFSSLCFPIFLSLACFAEERKLVSGHDDGREDRLSQRKTESRVGRTESDARRTASDEGRAASHARKATRRSGAHRRTGKTENPTASLCESHCEEAGRGREESPQEA